MPGGSRAGRKPALTAEPDPADAVRGPAARAAQLALDLRHPPAYERDSFVAADANRAALALIESWPDWPGTAVLLAGPPGSGKTHLARIWAARSGAREVAARRLDVDALDAAATVNLLVDDVEPGQVSERGLFHLLNRAAEAGRSVLLTSSVAATLWRPELPDLASRLRLATPAEIASPDEALLRAILVKLLADRQLIADTATLDFLLARMERTPAAAVRIVAATDGEALARGRPLTRALAAAVLRRLEGCGEQADQP